LEEDLKNCFNWAVSPHLNASMPQWGRTTKHRFVVRPHFNFNTWDRNPDRTKSYFDVFDKDGFYIAKILLKSRPHEIKNNKIYTIEEDEEGFQYVERYSIQWDLK
jgi:hypothetical protein